MDIIFCDGACSGNGTPRAVAGWAWAYWKDPICGEPIASAARRLDGVGPATNQRAELRALLEAMTWWRDVGGGKALTIYTDSMYAINCTSKWGPSWRRKGWKRDSGEPLQNLDLIKPLVEIWRPAWILQHVRGHQSGSSPLAYGNNWVDKAAVAAAAGSATTVQDRFNMTCLLPELEATLRVPTEEPAPSVRLPPIFKAGAASQQADIRKWFMPR